MATEPTITGLPTEVTQKIARQRELDITVLRRVCRDFERKTFDLFAHKYLRCLGCYPFNSQRVERLRNLTSSPRYAEKIQSITFWLDPAEGAGHKEFHVATRNPTVVFAHVLSYLPPGRFPSQSDGEFAHEEYTREQITKHSSEPDVAALDAIYDNLDANKSPAEVRIVFRKPVDEFLDLALWVDRFLGHPENLNKRVCDLDFQGTVLDPSTLCHIIGCNEQCLRTFRLRQVHFPLTDPWIVELFDYLKDCPKLEYIQFGDVNESLSSEGSIADDILVRFGYPRGTHGPHKAFMEVAGHEKVVEALQCCLDNGMDFVTRIKRCPKFRAGRYFFQLSGEHIPECLSI
ncbi:Hypothetical predicted protein [Lecanosticta acicola]|uniref:Uncharacterized protein n=1 Tax=Lecanosticta acicola TaxID=111012 RepID=A0AAI9E9Y9_9PEZI|nr:Hypothetical predicted protein [Lecanosticta acicola]